MRRRFGFLVRSTLVVLALAVASKAGATVLTFTCLGVPIQPEYGDRVTSIYDPVLPCTYDEGSGFTPNVVADYPVDSATPLMIQYGYGDLSLALGHTVAGTTAEVVLTPDPGYALILESFDVGALGQARTGSARVLGGDGSVLFDSGDVSIPGPGGGFSVFPNAAIVASGPLRILLSDFGLFGLDNVSFAQRAVPEPGSALLLGLGATALAVRRRRKR
jgi:hypothetical protein